MQKEERRRTKREQSGTGRRATKGPDVSHVISGTRASVVYSVLSRRHT